MKQPDQLILTPERLQKDFAKEESQYLQKSPNTVLRKKIRKLSQKYSFPPPTPHNTTQYLIETKPMVLSDTQAVLGTMLYCNLNLLLK